MREVDYEPKPMNTDDVQLAPDLLELREVLARNIHELWARQRMNEGWQWGATYDKGARTHPNLVDYDQLAEIDKDDDRVMALETLKVLTGLGYRISRT